ncbi:MAG: hypothetical protein EBT49_02895 [Betaproteobacteria bacterium]|nr:hypothetical protein [Betaproteobacteria bacterium]
MFHAFVRLRIITQRLCWSVCACWVLAGCSSLQFAYNSAPELTYWWLDGFLDFTSEQKPQVRADIHSFYSWHRSQQLGLYITWLERAQTMAGRNIQADEVCALMGEALDSLDTVTKELEPRVVRLLLTIEPAQTEQLQKQFTKKNREWRKEWLLGTPDELLDTRTDKGVEQAEKFYGRLDTSQKQLLRNLAKNSGYDPRMSYLLRLRRQADSVDTLRKLSTHSKDSDAFAMEWRQLVERTRNTPDPMLRQYGEDLKKANCAAVANLHNATTPQQRDRAAKQLQAYARDLRTLMERKP